MFQNEWVLLYNVKMEESPSTFLSLNVHEMIVVNSSYRCCKSLIINENLLLDWIAVDHELGNISECDCILENSLEWYKEKIKLLWGIMNFVEEKFCCYSNVKEKIFPLLSWIFDIAEAEDIYQKYKSNSDSDLLFCVLKITSYLDRALGDIYKSSCELVPFLLRDMLASNILAAVFGKTQIRFLQLLIGSVRGINLRNIAWHGFLTPKEINRSVVSTMFLIIASFGVSIKEYERRATIKHETLKKYSESILPYFLEIPFNQKHFLDVVKLCPFISKSHLEYWEYAVNLYSECRYGDSLIFLMPLKESLLRNVFCYANKCSQRILSAEETAFYTTLDDILAPHNGLTENRFQEVVGLKMLEILLDIYAYEEGPRLRDRISHSEVKPYDVPKELARCVFDISMILIILVTVKEKNESDNFPRVLDSECSSQFINAAINYEPQFHPSSMFKKSLLNIISKLKLWNDLPVPTELLVHLTVDKTSDIVDSFINVTGHSNISSYCQDITKKMTELKLSTIYRPKNEMELILIMRKILSFIEITDNNVAHCLITKHHQWENKLMRSRNRESYKRMLDCVPILQLGIGCILHMMIVVLEDCTTYATISHKQINRFLRLYQKYIENSSTMSSIKKNRWKELKDSTYQILKVVSKQIETKKS